LPPAESARPALPAAAVPFRPEPGVKVWEQGRDESKRIVAEMTVRAPPEAVWRVLTDYEALPTFVPNLERCERLPGAPPGRTLLRQRGCSQGALWRLEAEAVLEVEEVVGAMGRREARFAMVSGDFAELSGRWVVEPDPAAAAGSATRLRYDISLKPRLSLPSTIVSYVVRAGLPANIKAIAARAEAAAGARLGVAGLALWAGVEEDVALPAPPGAGAGEGEEAGGAFGPPAGFRRLEGLPTKGPFWPAGSPYAAAAPLTAEQQRRRAAAAAARGAYLGTASVPLPPAPGREAPGSAGGRGAALAARAAEKAAAAAAGYPAFGLRASLPAEVHLRRLDSVDELRRRAVASVRVDAPAAEVWAVLTDYDRLAEVVPALAASERIALPPGAPPNVVRVRQVGYKRGPYLCLHAETVLDLVERPAPRGGEIQFRQVAGDFASFQGKWMLAEAAPGAGAGARGYAGPATVLKYAVEISVPRAWRLTGVIEPLLERLVFEDVPINLAAIKAAAEAALAARAVAAAEARGEPARAAALRRRAERPRLPDMLDDARLLAAELRRCYGAAGALPTREELREAGRTDLEKAIAAHGGPAAVAERLGWAQRARARKPRGFWDALPNVRAEVDDFCDEAGLPRGTMPLKNDFVRAGRFDIARAVERWGGLFALAEELGYAVAERDGRTDSNGEWREHVSEVAASTGLSGREGLFELAASTYKRSDDGSGGDASGGGSDGSDGSGSGGGRRATRRRAAPKRESGARLVTARDEIDAW
jgi:hypothetical protein